MQKPYEGCFGRALDAHEKSCKTYLERFAPKVEYLFSVQGQVQQVSQVEAK